MASDLKAVINLIHKKPVWLAHQMGFTLLREDLHGDWLRWMIFGKEEESMLGAHRGSYKTTCLGIAMGLIAIVRPNYRVLFLRKTDDDVAEVMEVVGKVITNPYVQDLAKRMYGVYPSLTKTTYSQVDTNLKMGVAGAPQILGTGISGSLTGKHADRVFADDIVNKKDRVSRAEREAVKLTYQELHNVVNRGGRILVTGTPWHKDDAYGLIPKEHKHMFDCYSTGLMTRGEIEKQMARMSPSLFAANYELKHISDADAIFNTEAQFFTDYRLLQNGICHVDAAYGGKDKTAFTALKQGKDGKYYCFGMLWDKHVDKCLPSIKRYHRQLGLGSLWCENNADKGYLAREIEKLGIPTQTYHEHENKFIKISTFGRAAWEDVRWLDQTSPDYLSQILDYTENAEHDDAPDSYSSIIRAWKDRPVIKFHTVGL